ncbi:MAG: signal peptidase II [Rhodospirillales bacterium]|nr:signal peptidase II [Rhodospirillales bacterium]
MKNVKLIGLLTALVILIADQVSKWVVLASSIPQKPIEILPVFNLVLVWNKGISFGMFTNHGDMGPYILSALSLVIAAGFSIWLFRTHSRFLALAIGLVIGGAVGNVIDRLRFGAVVDFLDFHIGTWHYPAFNVADSAIVIGIAFIVFDGLFCEPKRRDSRTNEQDN